jgi:hypothetical protein
LFQIVSVTICELTETFFTNGSQVEHHPSKTSDFLLLLFLEVCESVWILDELNLVDEQHIDEHENCSFFDK